MYSEGLALPAFLWRYGQMVKLALLGSFYSEDKLLNMRGFINFTFPKAIKSISEHLLTI